MASENDMNIKTWLKNKRSRINKWFFARLARRKLIWKKEEDIAVFEIMEAYITEKVLAGDENRREELAEMQRKIEEFDLFIKFLKKI